MYLNEHKHYIMKWINYKERKPKKSQPYVVSIGIPTNEKDEFIFKYVAYYDAELDSWFKYDPFGEGKKEEIIKGNIFAWIENLLTFTN